MKRLLIIPVLFLSISMLSCGSDDAYFSCNPEIDRWVKDNLESVNTMTRSEWNKVGDLAYQRALYNAFSAGQRQRLWVEKFEKALPLFIDKNEKSHMELLLTSIKDNRQWFENNNDETIKNSFEIFCYIWIDYAKSVLNWNPDTLYAVIGTPEDIAESQRGDIIVNSALIARPATKSRTEDGYGKVCDCGNGSEYFECSGWSGYTCKIDYNAPCRQTERGCGSLWQNACWGECKAPSIL